MTSVANAPPFADNPSWANRQIASAWETFVATGKFTGITPRPVIAESWTRCRSLGISPRTQRAPTQISVDEIEAVLAEAALGRAGREVLDGYVRMVEGSGHVIVLADTAGRILYSVGLKGTRDQLERINFFPGGLWVEEAVGPNGVGTPLALGRPEVVFGTEHYCEGWQPWVCYGSPVRNPQTGESMGVVDITGPARNAHIETLALTVAIAQAVEHKLHITDLMVRDSLRSRFRDIERRWPNEGLLLVSENGRVLDANSEALRRLDCNLTVIRDRDVAELNDALSEIIRSDPASGTDAPLSEQELAVPSGLLRVRAERVDHNGARAGTVVIVSKTASRTPMAAPRRGIPSARYTFSDLIGRSAVFQQTVQLARMAARDRRENPVLISGESGTGKELLAHAIHATSRRATGPFIVINCGAMPPDLAESELFGYAGGAFTGAQRGGALGKFEAADGGTLFMDEVDSLPLAIQAKFLRALEEKTIVRVGSVESVAVDVRVIAAASSVLREQAGCGGFRSDLFHRLSVIEIPLPPLRDRIEDIEPLASLFLAEACKEAGRAPLQLSPEVLQSLLSYPWPGNIRELRNLCARWVLTVDGDTVEVAHVPRHVGSRALMGPEGVAEGQHGGLRAIEEDLMRRTLAECHGSISATARRLGVDRSTIYRRLRPSRKD